MTAEDCLFCKVARGEIPAGVVKRTGRLLAFRDINPQAPTHLLVIPTEHVGSLDETGDGTLLGDLLLFARQTTPAKTQVELNRLIDLLRKHGVEITSVVRQRSTLEESFLSLLKQEVTT